MCEAKYKDQARRDEILTDMRRTEASLLYASWKASHDVLRHTIRTVTEPSLCWVPAVSTPMTDLLLTKSAERVDAELALQDVRGVVPQIVRLRCAAVDAPPRRDADAAEAASQRA